MVTIHDLTWDDDRLLDLMLLLDSAEHGCVMRAASVAACYAVAKRDAAARNLPVTHVPEEVTLKELWRCAPTLPCGWSSDTDFQFEVENSVKQQLGDGAIDMVLTTSDHDERNAELLADWAATHASRIGSKFCAPSFEEEGYVAAEDMRRFIEEWRDSFMTNLRGGHVAPDRGRDGN